MLDQTTAPQDSDDVKKASDWVAILASYREPSTLRSCFELAVTIGPFLILWAMAWWSMSISYWLTLAIASLNAAFLLRLFTIQHDCGHGAFFANRTVGDWLGRVIGVLTLTPYDVWRKTHAIHHGSTGNLARRGIGDIMTLTVEEYENRTRFGRFIYRLYRHPITLFGVVPGYLFFVQNRVPLGLTNKLQYWISAMGTNAALIVALGLILYFGGIMPVLLIFLPTSLLAATAGVWLFYVQHQFETAHWEREENWKIHDAALEGSSHYVMPAPLQWLTANIGVHHVHHLYSRIPFYRLPEVLANHRELAEANRLTIRESLASVKLRLWDEQSRELLSFAEAKRRRATA